MSSLKWVRIVLGVVIGFLIAVVGNMILETLYLVVVGFQMRGAPPPEVRIAVITSLPLQLVAVLMALLGGFVGGRFAARPAETNHQLAGLVTGILLAILVVIWRALSWGAPDVWMVIQAVLAVLGGWLGGRLAARRTEEEYDESPQL